MVKLTTRLINDTNKPLVLCEEASNGSQTRIKVLDPRVPDKQTPEGDEQNAVLVTNQSTRKTKLAGYSPSFYVHSVDPNDSYATLRLWFGKKAVLGVSSDDMIDNMTITIKELEEGVFSKHCDPRYEIANNQHWNSRLFLGFVEHQFHKVIV
ncbi:unnamed protein product [Sphagnum jensenii]|jgi:hypothetical protein|uniref:DUF7748 domain-containing protein n=1 Tax=Sphagnum jensenii TaxID=128206 RepID=A0ABP0WGA9_9BRYO